MPFRPEVNYTLNIDGVTYTIPPHPQSPRYPFAQEGSRATVYQLHDGKQSKALKVFKSVFQNPQTAHTAVLLGRYATVAGFGVCERVVFQPTQDGIPPLQEPDLNYAVLMPWVEGTTWYDVITNTETKNNGIDAAQARTLAQVFLTVLLELEMNGITHCDLSPGNVLVRFRPPEVDLIDVEDICAEGMPIPVMLPRGTPGYSHTTATDGMWHPYADRFAGALLLCEMICWSDARFRAAYYGESFFSPHELQTNCERYTVLHDILGEIGGTEAQAIFERAWFSEKLSDAPPFWEWAHALQSYFRKVVPSYPPSADVVVPQLDHAIAEHKKLLHSLSGSSNEASEGATLLRTIRWLERERQNMNVEEGRVARETTIPRRAVSAPVVPKVTPSGGAPKQQSQIQQSSDKDKSSEGVEPVSPLINPPVKRASTTTYAAIALGFGGIAAAWYLLTGTPEAAPVVPAATTTSTAMIPTVTAIPTFTTTPTAPATHTPTSQPQPTETLVEATAIVVVPAPTQPPRPQNTATEVVPTAVPSATAEPTAVPPTEIPTEIPTLPPTDVPQKPTKEREPEPTPFG